MSGGLAVASVAEAMPSSMVRRETRSPCRRYRRLTTFQFTAANGSRWREPTEKQGKWLRRIADKVKAHWAKQTRETPLRNAGSRGGLEEAPLPRARATRTAGQSPRGFRPA